jgi:gliding motility-associated-like protein
MTRKWKVQESGTVGTVKVGVLASDVSTAGSVSLFVSNDATIDGLDNQYVMTLETIGGVSYYTTTVDFTDGQYFSFGVDIASLPRVNTGETSTYSIPGTYSYTIPACVNTIIVETWGAGGGGGGNTTGSYGGGGGGGGAYSMSTLTVTPGATYSIVVGSGGAGGASVGNHHGAVGSDSRFTTSTGTVLVLAKGGSGGFGPAGARANAGTGGSSALGSGTIRYSGGNGGQSFTNATYSMGGGGGSSAGYTQNGRGGITAYEFDYAHGFPGGAAPVGGARGGTGSAFAGACSYRETATDGNVGGGGGGGASEPDDGNSNTSSVSSAKGGDGGEGKVVVSYIAVQTVSQVGTNVSTWTVPAGITKVIVQAWGGGGGGGGAFSESEVSVTPGTTFSVTVGAGGIGGTPTNNVAGNGVAGGDSWFTSSTTTLVLAKGGSGGTRRAGSTSAPGGAGGSTASGIGMFMFSGGNGGNGGSDFGHGGGGGASAGYNAAGGNGTNALNSGCSGVGGNGGIAPLGGVDGPTGNAHWSRTHDADSHGAGGAGSGEYNAKGGTDGYGGAGGDGMVVLDWSPIFSLSTISTNTLTTVNGYICSGDQFVPIHSFEMRANNLNSCIPQVEFTQFSFVPTGTYDAGDINYFKFYYTPTDQFNADTVALGVAAFSGSGNTVTFSGFTNVFNVSNTPRYFWVTAYTKTGYTNGHTIAVNASLPANFGTSKPLYRASSATARTGAGATKTFQINSLNSTLTPSPICSGSVFTYTPTSAQASPTFSWTLTPTADISAPSTAGTGNVNQIITNASTNTLSATFKYVTESNGCSNSGENVVVTVNPLPQLNSTLSPPAICSGSVFSYTATSATSGATLSWSRPAVAGITSPGASSGTGNISQQLNNSTTAPIVVAYTYTTTANGCTGAVQTVTVTVNPIPVLSSTLSPSPICSGSAFTYTATSATSGATFDWSRAAVAEIDEPANSGSGNITENLTNSATYTVNVTYTYTTTANGCSNTGENVVVRVNPIPVLSSTLTPSAICSGTTFTYTATSATTGSTFAWDRVAIAGITSPGSASGTGNVSQVLDNSTTDPIAVAYTYTTTANGCSNTGETVTVTVNPIPVLSTTLTPDSICTADLFGYTPNSLTGGASYAWSRSAVVGITPTTSNGTGAVSETLTNGTTSPLNATYSYTTTANGCSNTGENVVVTVRPNANIVLTSALSTNNQRVCKDAAITDITYTVNSVVSTATVTGLPTGVTSVFAANTLTISGNANVEGVFIYTVATTGLCVQTSTTGTITSGLSLIPPFDADTQRVCRNVSITDIQYAVGSASASIAWTPSAPSGIFANYAAGVFTITGTPDTDGSYTYTLTTSVECSPPTSKVGMIVVGLGLNNSSASTVQNVCVDEPIDEIAMNISGGSASIVWSPNTPLGISSGYVVSNSTYTINGYSSAQGSYTYTVSSDGCSPVSQLTGTITIGIGQPANSAPLSQIVCNSFPLSAITIDFAGTTPDIEWAGPNGGIIPPTGVTSGTATATTFTIGGTPTSDGTYTYTVTTVGCTPNSVLTGTITVGIGQPANSAPLSQIVCNSSSLSAITIDFAGTTPDIFWAGPNGGIIPPTGVSSGTATATTFTIGGTPTSDGTYTYTVSTVGCTPNSVLTGTITVGIGQPANSAPLSQIVCNSSPLSAITIDFAGTTPDILWAGPNGGIIPPTGVSSGTATATTFTIGGTPTSDGTYTYTVSAVGCSPNSVLTGTITVGIGQPANSAPLSQIVCNSSPLSAITIDFAGTIPDVVWTGPNGGIIPPTGVSSGTATATTFTIGGTPTSDGTYTYTISTMGCFPNSVLTGTITVGIGQPSNSAPLSQIVCNSSPLSAITINFAGTTPDIKWAGPNGGITPPTGVSSGTATATTFTIGGAPTDDGTYTYTVSTMGCFPNSVLTGTITVGIGQPANSAPLTQIVCNNSPLSAITIDFAGTTPDIKWAGPNGGIIPPTGVSSGTATATTFTIGGTPTDDGTYTYTVSTMGCFPNSVLTGTITAGIGQPVNSAPLSQIVCNSTPLSPITIDFAGSAPTIVWASLSGTLAPIGVTSGTATATSYTIGGLPTSDGTYTYSVTLGACSPPSILTGTITVGIGQPANSAPLSQIVCNSTSLSAITIDFAGTTPDIKWAGPNGGIIPPTGVTSGTATATTFTIGGTPTSDGTYTYTVSTMGCTPNSVLTGTITVGIGQPANSAPLSQIVCNSSPLSAITIDFAGTTPDIKWAGPNGGIIPPTGVSSGTAAATTFTIGGIPTSDGTYTYTVTTIGCSPNSVLTGTITVGIGQPITSSSLSQVVCKSTALSPITIDFAGTEPTIFWTDPNGGIVAPTGVSSGTATATTYSIGGTPSQDGTYTYTVITNGCSPSSSLTGTITVGIGQPITSASLSQVICKSSALSLITIDFAGNIPSVFWAGPNGGIVPPTGISTGTATATTYTIGGIPTEDGTYTYTVITNGCNPSSQLTGTITVGIGQPSTSAPLNQIVCNGTALSPIHLNFAGGNTPIIVWASLSGTLAPIGVTSGTTSATTYSIGGTPTQDGTYSYTVTNNGCSPSSQLSGTITVGLGQPITSAPLSQIVCNGNPLSLIMIDFAGGSIPDIVWAGPNGAAAPNGVTSYTATAATYTIGGTPTQDGTYTYSVTTSGCTPQSILTGTITVGIGISGTSASLSQDVCKDNALGLIVLNVGGTPSIAWNGSNGLLQPQGVSSGTATATTFTIGGTPTVAGSYSYTVSMSGCVGSSLSGVINVDQVSIVLISAAGTDNQQLCANDVMTTLTYSVISYYGTPAVDVPNLPSGVSYTYNSSTKVVTITGSIASGEFVGNVIAVSALNCNTSTTNFSLKVLTPVAAFSKQYDTENPVPKLLVEFLNTSTGADTYNWDFGDGNTSAELNPTNTYEKEGIYTILLKSSIASSNSVCWDTTSQVIAVYELKIPNVFTPNGDEINDVFAVQSVGISKIEGEIYDRWGTKVYTWSSQNDAWTGRSRFTELNCSAGTYYYIIKVTDFTGKVINRKGFILLVRD